MAKEYITHVYDAKGNHKGTNFSGIRLNDHEIQQQIKRFGGANAKVEEWHVKDSEDE